MQMIFDAEHALGIFPEIEPDGGTEVAQRVRGPRAPSKGGRHPREKSETSGCQSASIYFSLEGILTDIP